MVYFATTNLDWPRLIFSLQPDPSAKATAGQQQIEYGIDGYEVLGTAHCMAANRISYFFDLKGPSFTIDTACSSSLIAVDRARRDIQSGIIERAIVCGVSLCLDHCKNAILIKAQMLSPTGHCHTFDSRADGYSRADGIAAIVLEKGTSGYAMLVGSGTNQDGATPGITYPNPDSQVALMSDVFAASGVVPEDVTYHEAHGTGTVAGDTEELAALSRVYKHSLCIGSVKSNMGHSEGASGLMGISKILLMYEDRMLYPNHDFQDSPHEVIGPARFNVLKQYLILALVVATPSPYSNRALSGEKFLISLMCSMAIHSRPPLVNLPPLDTPTSIPSNVPSVMTSHSDTNGAQVNGILKMMLR
jgi:acyl transferase domain-containing protein